MSYDVIDLGLMDYREAYAYQKALHHKRYLKTIPDTLLLLEHPNVITLGRLAKEENVLASFSSLEKDNIEVVHIDRGGDVTIHMPGQLVGYLIFDLNNWGKDVHLFLRKIEEVLMKFFSQYNIKASRKKKATGAWVDDKKVGFIGLGISKWISFHGFSININPDLKLFSLINPCGFNSDAITSLEELLDHSQKTEKVRESLLKSFGEVFITSNFSRG